MIYKPDVEGLLRRPTITKPQEEFLLPPPLDPVTLPDPAQARAPQPAAAPTLADQLVSEAGELQALLDLISQTAPPLALPVPAEHQATLGAAISTADYLAGFPAPGAPADPYHPARQQLFDWGLLRGTGCGLNAHWPLLAVGDLVDLKNTLLNAAAATENVLEPGFLPVPVPPASGASIAQVHVELLQSSQRYRLKFGHVVATMRADAASHLIGLTLRPAIGSSLAVVRPALQDAQQVFRLLKAALCHSQLLLAFEFVQVRDVLAGLIQEALFEQLLNILNRFLAQATLLMVRPLTDFFQRDVQGQPLVAALEDGVSRAICGMVTAACHAMQQQYLDLGADLLRQLRQRERLRMAKLQSLGEHNLTGRWIQHLDLMLTQIDRLLATPNFQFVQEVGQLAASRLPPPAHALLDQYGSSDRFVQTDLPFPVRTTPFTGGNPDLAPVDHFVPVATGTPEFAFFAPSHPGGIG